MTRLSPPTWIGTWQLLKLTDLDSRSQKSNHPTNCWPLAVKSDVFQPPKREEICKHIEKASSRPKVDQILYSLLLNHLRYQKKWKFDKVVWPRSDGSSYTSYWNLNFWGDLRIPETWVDISVPSRICVNQQTIILQNENTLKHPTHEWVSLLGISLMIFPNWIPSTPSFC